MEYLFNIINNLYFTLKFKFINDNLEIKRTKKTLIFDKYIDKIIYINLKEANERNYNCILELKKIFCPEKIIRFNAIKNKYYGATQSHKECLELAIKNNWNNVLIIEDDISITDNFDINLFEKLVKNTYDVIHLGATFLIYNPFNYNLYSCHSGTAYLVNNHYFIKLKNHYEESLAKINNSIFLNKKYDKYIFDSYWRILQIKDNWKVVYPPIFIQKDNYSYINDRKMTHEYAFYDCNIKFISNRYYDTFYNIYKIDYININKYLKLNKKEIRLILFIIIFPHYLYLNFKQYEIIRYIFSFPQIMFLLIILFLPIFEILKNQIKFKIN